MLVHSIVREQDKTRTEALAGSLYLHRLYGHDKVYSAYAGWGVVAVEEDKDAVDSVLREGVSGGGARSSELRSE